MTARVEEAMRWSARRRDPRRDINPVYRALAGADGPDHGDTAFGPDHPAVGPDDPAGGSDVPCDEAESALLARHLCAPALLIATVAHQGSTRRLRISLTPDAVSLESSHDDRPSRWTTGDLDTIAPALADLLDGTGLHLDAPLLTVDRAAATIRPTAEQAEQARHALRAGSSPEEAFSAIADLDPRLRAALDPDAPRLSLSLVLHSPGRRAEPTAGAGAPATAAAAPPSASFSRLWVRGGESLYRLDAGAPAPAVRPVPDGDVLGTLLPIVQEGLRFAAACPSAPSSTPSSAPSAEGPR
ncbi:hypothetical protein ACXET9_01725 [Brachybacterium sp. DNPG3]